jgi:hypothetical protein
METTNKTIGEMDKEVRDAIAQARKELKTDKASLDSLEAWARSWHELCYQLVMSYTGLSLMRLVKAENADKLFQIAHRFVPQKARTRIAMEISKILSAYMN